jgi:hypothetical protein
MDAFSTEHSADMAGVGIKTYTERLASYPTQADRDGGGGRRPARTMRALHPGEGGRSDASWARSNPDAG